MEVYKSLQKQFLDSLSPRHNLPQLKKIGDDIVCLTQQKQIHLAHRQRQLAQLQKQPKSGLVDSRASVQSRMSKMSERAEQAERRELALIQQNAMSNSIAQLQNEINLLRNKTHEVNQNVQIFRQQQDQVKIQGKRSQMQALNMVQNLYIEASRQKDQQLKEQEMLLYLSNKKEVISGDIEGLMRQKETNQSVVSVMKLRQRNQVERVRNARGMAEGSEELKLIVTTILELQLLHIQHERQKEKVEEPEENTIQQALNIGEHLNKLRKLNYKLQVITFLEDYNIKIDQALINQIVGFNFQLSNIFDQNQRANNQINSQLSSLRIQQDSLNAIIEKAQIVSQQQHQQSIRQAEDSLTEKQVTVKKISKLISFFSSNYHCLLKKYVSVNKTLQQIVQDKRFVSQTCTDVKEMVESEKIVISYDEKLNKNRQDEGVKWVDQTGDFQSFYRNSIESNDLLRIFASPQMYNKNMDSMSNLDKLMMSSLKSANDFIRHISMQIKQYFLFYRENTSIKSHLSTDPSPASLCLQSQEYYRRDNFKLLDKLNKIQLKRKGLLTSIPFHVELQDQLQPHPQEQNNLINCLSTPSLSSGRKYMKYTNLATRREDNSRQGRNIRMLFSRLNHISSSRCQSRGQLSSLKDSKVSKLCDVSFRNQSRLRKTNLRATLPRNTVGATFTPHFQ